MQTGRKSPRIDCYIFQDCGSENALRAVIDKVKEVYPGDITVVFHKITPAEADRVGIKGSPTVLVDGIDVSSEGLPATGGT